MESAESWQKPSFCWIYSEGLTFHPWHDETTPQTAAADTTRGWDSETLTWLGALLSYGGE